MTGIAGLDLDSLDPETRAMVNEALLVAGALTRRAASITRRKGLNDNEFLTLDEWVVEVRSALARASGGTTPLTTQQSLDLEVAVDALNLIASVDHARVHRNNNPTRPQLRIIK